MSSSDYCEEEDRRYASVERRKSEGATYTPKRFAEFVVARMLTHFALIHDRSLRILDPACGDGSLLESLLSALPESSRRGAQVVGFDTDANAIGTTQSRLSGAFPEVKLRIEVRDFLDYAMTLEGSGNLQWTNVDEPFDLVIANPPYVRTQILGTRQAQEIAREFGLTGRVDLYFPFLLGISRLLHKDGVVGVIVSNRFMTTKSGRVVRRHLLSRFKLCQVLDLGDTKLFDAAVLPAVLLARGRGTTTVEETAASSIYSSDGIPDARAVDALAALDCPSNSIVEVDDGQRYRVIHGALNNGGVPDGVWRIATMTSDTWLSTVRAHTWGRFSSIGKIRVGVKTTADKVFIRADWNTMRESERPELLRALTTRRNARRFKPLDTEPSYLILYPHEATETGRRVTDLRAFPKSARYLEGHRTALEARTYVIAAGRQWYEIWVPQDPASWAHPKLVFLDISEKPTFWMDTKGTIVSGECYWLRCDEQVPHDLLWLALAVANSTFIEVFYDHCFHNKLYAGRRRFITQYVEQFPLPSPDSELAMTMIAIAKQIYASTESAEANRLGSDLDTLVWRAFGLPIEEVAGKRDLELAIQDTTFESLNRLKKSAPVATNRWVRTTTWPSDLAQKSAYLVSQCRGW